MGTSAMVRSLMRLSMPLSLVCPSCVDGLLRPFLLYFRCMNNPALFRSIQSILPPESDLLTHVCEGIPRDRLHVPSMEGVLDTFAQSDRSEAVQKNLATLFAHGRLGATGYLSILPVDQGVEHSAGASFAKNPLYFDPEYLVRLALEGGCNAIASTVGGLGIVAKKYAAQIPFIVKLNHNELLSYPNTFDQTLFASVAQAKSMGAVGVGATIYFGSPESRRQIREVAEAFAEAHREGLFTVLWCYLRNPAFKRDIDYHTAADLTAQANYLGVTLGADIIKQKLPTCNGGFAALSQESAYGKTDPAVYETLTTEHPIDLARYQVAHCFMGRIPMLSSGGASGGNDLQEAVTAAVINKRAGGSGLIAGRKAFEKSMEEGIALLHAIQDVYLCEEVTVA